MKQHILKGKSLFKTLVLAVFTGTVMNACAQPTITEKNADQLTDSSVLTTKETKMKIEIWSDVVCPFCYIGKTKFETALNQFAEKNNIEIEWKSFQLMPDMVTQPTKNADQVLAESKGWSIEQAAAMNQQAAAMGKQAGLDYRFDKAIIANTFKAHQFLHFAKVHGKQNEAEGLLFQSYFTNGKNIDDITTLLELGKTLQLDLNELKEALEKESYAKAVKADIKEANDLGVRGVPFFVFDRKYAISGAQDSKVFLETLEKAYHEWVSTQPTPPLNITNGNVCEPNNNNCH